MMDRNTIADIIRGNRVGIDDNTLNHEVHHLFLWEADGAGIMRELERRGREIDGEGGERFGRRMTRGICVELVVLESYEPYYERDFTEGDELISRAEGLDFLTTRDLIDELKDRLSKRDYEDQLERRVSGPPYDTVEKCRDILDRNAHIEVLENLVYTLETCRKLIQQRTGVLPPVNWTVRPRTPSPPPPAAGKAGKVGGRR
ncbi:hypothetical protein DFP72DRAFT_1082471 [Ephemerocybe angulata]|uniref:Uncharacterized protein n=1 Tax=Ephemerocybe angulata TaxID=980116 RepID=A0A8H6H833_9AGAR|nr:hypothetical protein DFP72DRAFT_1082471 [Tulosesus angulatus]